MGCSSSKDCCSDVDRPQRLGSDGGCMHSGTPTAVNESRATARHAARPVTPRRRASRCPASALADLDAPLPHLSEQPYTQRHRVRPVNNCWRNAVSSNSADNGPTFAVAAPTPTASEQKKRSQEALRRRVQRDLQQSAVEMDRMFRDHFGAGSLSLSAESTPTSARTTASREQEQR